MNGIGIGKLPIDIHLLETIVVVARQRLSVGEGIGRRQRRIAPGRDDPDGRKVRPIAAALDVEQFAIAFTGRHPGELSRLIFADTGKAELAVHGIVIRGRGAVVGDRAGWAGAGRDHEEK